MVGKLSADRLTYSNSLQKSKMVQRRCRTAVKVTWRKSSKCVNSISQSNKKNCSKKRSRLLRILREREAVTSLSLRPSRGLTVHLP